jgi:hypothetical protein
MTIILPTKRDPFVVIAADRWTGKPRGDGSYCDQHSICKVIAHPKLPLAFAVGKDMWLPLDAGGGSETVAFVTRFANSIQTRDADFVLATIADPRPGCRILPMHGRRRSRRF